MFSKIIVLCSDSMSSYWCVMFFKLSKNTWLNFIVVLILCITTSYSIVYSNIENFPELNSNGNADASIYLAMYKNKPMERYESCRILTPVLAKLLPDFPRTFFSESRKVSDKYWMARVKFGIVNFSFLVGIGLLLFYYLRNYGFNTLESIIGCLVFYTARPLIQNAGAPMVDASSYFFLLLCLYAIQCENILIFLIGFSVGLLAKESVVLALFVLMLSQMKSKLKVLFLLMPVIVAYILIRHMLIKSEPFL